MRAAVVDADPPGGPSISPSAASSMRHWRLRDVATRTWSCLQTCSMGLMRGGREEEEGKDCRGVVRDREIVEEDEYLREYFYGPVEQQLFSADCGNYNINHSAVAAYT